MSTFEFKLPDLGEGVVEGEIVKWLVKEGDVVAEDQGLIEIMTDKATVTVPSPRRGRVAKVHGKEGEMAKVHQVLVTFEAEEGAPTSTVQKSAQPQTVLAPFPARAGGGARPLQSGAKLLATPVTRRMAREHGLDLMDIVGSGPQGRVTKADVMAAMAEGGVAAAKLRPLSSGGPVVALQRPGSDERIPLRGLRKKIAEKMVRSKFTAPHFTFVEEVDATELVTLRKRLNDSLTSAKESTKLSFLPFLCKALISCMRQFPHLNANMDEATQELVVRAAYNFGVAAATPEGLTVPVVKNVDRFSLRELAEEISRLGNAAKDRRLKMEELSGGTFTITSLGQTGGLFATPIINHPEVAILGVHRIRKRPVVVEDQIVIREMMNISLSFDHRVIDGSVGADFTYALIRQLEQPELLLLEMA